MELEAPCLDRRSLCRRRPGVPCRRGSGERPSPETVPSGKGCGRGFGGRPAGKPGWPVSRRSRAPWRLTRHVIAGPAPGPALAQPAERVQRRHGETASLPLCSSPRGAGRVGSSWRGPRPLEAALQTPVVQEDDDLLAAWGPGRPRPGLPGAGFSPSGVGVDQSFPETESAEGGFKGVPAGGDVVHKVQRAGRQRRAAAGEAVRVNGDRAGGAAVSAA